jgi:membrane protease YdiL (CAAX protease family)
MVYLFEKAGLGVAADPIALFVFALMLGVLYLRTHRIGPSIVAHMGLNLTSLMLARF